MKVQIIRSTVAQKRSVMPGDVLEVSKDEAVQLIAANKAIALKDSPVETASIPQVQAEAPAPDPVVEFEQAQPVKPRGKKKASE